MLMAAGSLLAQASSPVHCTGHSYLVSPSGLLHQRDSWCQSVIGQQFLYVVFLYSEFLPAASCFLSLLFDESALSHLAFGTSSDVSCGLCQRSIDALLQIIQTERFHKVWCIVVSNLSRSSRISWGMTYCHIML